jgi:hypothetical protein
MFSLDISVIVIFTKLIYTIAFSFFSEDSVYNFDTASTTPSSSAKTQGSSEVLKIEEINLVT